MVSQDQLDSFNANSELWTCLSGRDSGLWIEFEHLACDVLAVLANRGDMIPPWIFGVVTDDMVVWQLLVALDQIR